VFLQTGMNAGDALRETLRQLGAQAASTGASQVSLAESMEMATRAQREASDALAGLIAQRLELRDFFTQLSSWINDSRDATDGWKVATDAVVGTLREAVGLRAQIGTAQGQSASGAFTAEAGAIAGRLRARGMNLGGFQFGELGVRGTEFRTVAAPQLARLEVLEGAVAMNAAGTADIVTVDAGQGAQAAAQGVAAPRPLPAAPVLDAMPARIERLPLTIGWPAQPGAARYRAQLFDAQGGLVLDGLFEAPLARWTEAVPDGDYALHVRSADDAGLEGRDATAAFVLAARPEPPLVSAPRAGARLSGPQVRFEWTRNPNAAHYRLQLADSTDFAAPRIDRSDLTEPQLVLDVPAGTHYWRLASIRADGHRGPWGDALRFERITLPPAPTSSAPSTSDEGVLLRWSSPAAGAQRSHVQVARDAQFAQLVVDEQTTADAWLLHHPEPGIYYVRIRSIQADGFAGPFGEVQQLDVAPARPLWPALVPIVLFLLL